MTSAKPRGKPKRFGTVVVESGCLALVMAHAAGKAPASKIAAAKEGTSVIRYAGGSLVPMQPGTYVTWYEKIEKETDDGFLVGRLLGETRMPGERRSPGIHSR